MYSFILSAAILFAEADGAAGGAQGGEGGPGDFLRSYFLPLMLIMLLYVWFIAGRPQRQERARQKAMLAALKKNDRVLTAGGIYGVVVNVDREAHHGLGEVTLKVDEASNSKIRVQIGAIAQVFGDEPPADTASK